METPIRTLKVIQDEVSTCEKCELHATRTQTVFSRGNPEAAICIVGEAPGEDEDKTGIPFVGRSGNLLDKTLTEVGLDPTKDVYVCNVIKCRPPNNRRPTDDEVNCCIDYLEEQLKIVNPKVIIALGNTAVGNLISNPLGITKIHGKFFKRGTAVVMPAYHPSYVLRSGGKGVIFDDFKKDLQSALAKSKEEKEEKHVEKELVSG